MEYDSDDSFQPNTEIRDTSKQAKEREDRYLEREKRRAEYDLESRNNFNELCSELEKMERYYREKSAELEIKIRNLESGKRSVEDENEGLKKRFTELGIESSMHKHNEVQVERDDREKYSELEVKIRDLESGKRRVEGENESLKRRFTELGIEFSRLKHEVEVEKVELEVRRTKYVELSMELQTTKMECSSINEKFEDLMVSKIAVEDELKECIRREKKAQETIAQLLEELKKKEYDKSVIYVQFKNDDTEPEECRRKIAEEETEIWKKKCNVYKIACSRLKHQICEREKMAQRRITNLPEELKKMERNEEELRGTSLICRESHLSGVIESEPTKVSHNDDINKTIRLQSEPYGGDNNGALVVRVTGVDMQCLPVKNVEEDFEFGKGFGKQLVLELEGTKEMQSVLDLGSIRPASGKIIDISDDSSDNSLIKEKDLAPKKCLKRLYSDQRGEIYGGRCNEDSPFTSSSKRKRASESPNASCGGLNVDEKNGWAEKTSPNEHTSMTQLDLSGFKLEGFDSSDSGYSSSDSEGSVNLQLVFDNVSKMFFDRKNLSNSKVESDKGAHKLQHYR